MVSLITEGTSSNRSGRPFARRRRFPAAVAGGVLAAATIVVWTSVLSVSDATSETVACPPPPTTSSDPEGPAPAPLGEVVAMSTLTDVDPAPLASTRVRVYNSNGQRGQASHVAAQLGDYGFASAPDVQAGNDPVFVDQNMQCHGQIRFGDAGRASANTVRLVAPCAELVLDGREDDTVDLALGTYFSDMNPSPDAEEILRTLRDAPVGDQSAPLDISLLDAALNSRC